MFSLYINTLTVTPATPPPENCLQASQPTTMICYQIVIKVSPSAPNRLQTLFRIMSESTDTTYALVFAGMTEEQMGKGTPSASQKHPFHSCLCTDAIYIDAFENIDDSRRALELKGCRFPKMNGKAARLCMYYGIAKLAGIHHGRDVLHPYLVAAVRAEFTDDW